jgi:hypothetical protein
VEPTTPCLTSAAVLNARLGILHNASAALLMLINRISRAREPDDKFIHLPTSGFPYFPVAHDAHCKGKVSKEIQLLMLVAGTDFRLDRFPLRVAPAAISLLHISPCIHQQGNSFTLCLRLDGRWLSTGLRLPG